jgi:hypothetical protein
VYKQRNYRSLAAKTSNLCPVASAIKAVQLVPRGKKSNYVTVVLIKQHFSNSPVSRRRNLGKRGTAVPPRPGNGLSLVFHRERVALHVQNVRSTYFLSVSMNVSNSTDILQHSAFLLCDEEQLVLIMWPSGSESELLFGFWSEECVLQARRTHAPCPFLDGG